MTGLSSFAREASDPDMKGKGMDDLLQDVLTMECMVWDALVSGDTRSYRAALSEDFMGAYPDGFFGREDQIATLTTGPTVAAYALSQERVRAMGDDHALLTYHARFQRAGQTAWEEMRVSSLWRREGAGWVNLFSQDTPEGRPVP